ncbi:hypothetical protein T265_14588, partial [Opisthorchis viverrini]
GIWPTLHRKVRGSNPTSDSRLPVFRLGRPDSILAPLFPSSGMIAIAGRHIEFILRVTSSISHSTMYPATFGTMKSYGEPLVLLLLPSSEVQWKVQRGNPEMDIIPLCLVSEKGLPQICIHQITKRHLRVRGEECLYADTRSPTH